MIKGQKVSLCSEDIYTLVKNHKIINGLKSFVL